MKLLGRLLGGAAAVGIVSVGLSLSQERRRPISSSNGAEQASPLASLSFQTDRPWSPRTNINADTVLVYGIDGSVAQRIQSWRAHGYHTTVMTGVAWGKYGDYLRGEFDGKPHWDETQEEKDGTLRLHSGREVPYIAPTMAYGRYLARGVLLALDAGAEAVVLEEPEFWANTGWSQSFRREWQDFYHEPWRAPDSSTDAQYRTSKLKYFLYRRALTQVFQAVKEYGTAHHRSIPCYVATHSLINYAQWGIVSPESSLLEAGADGYIAQVWTGTAREPNVYQGVRQERTFETAFLEYGALQNIARASGKPIWYLNDPIEDNPRHSWTDYRQNWQSTLIASLLQPAVARYEVLPWPDRIFGPKALRPVSEPSQADPNPAKTFIPKAYETELQTVFHALSEMNVASKTIRWEAAGTDRVGVLLSDTLMFQRAAPQPSDSNLGNVYGLALPLLMHGVPVESVQIETATLHHAVPGFLDRYKVLLLTYEGQKPFFPEFHDALATWVKAGGALIVVDDDHDPYRTATDWWNSGSNHFATPREHLFQRLGIAASATGLSAVGKGRVWYARQSPSALTYQEDGAFAILKLVQAVLQSGHMQPLRETNALVLRRGAYVIAAGLEQTVAGKTVTIRGDLVNLFDENLPITTSFDVSPGARALLLDVDYFRASGPRVIAVSAKVRKERATAHALDFEVQGIDETEGVARVLLPRRPRTVVIGDTSLRTEGYEPSGRTLLLRFRNRATPQTVHISF